MSERDILSVQAETIGTIAVPRDWTDKADPSPYAESDKQPILSIVHLLLLSEILQQMDKEPQQDSLDKE